MRGSAFRSILLYRIVGYSNSASIIAHNNSWGLGDVQDQIILCVDLQRVDLQQTRPRMYSASPALETMQGMIDENTCTAPLTIDFERLVACDCRERNKHQRRSERESERGMARRRERKESCRWHDRLYIVLVL